MFEMKSIWITQFEFEHAIFLIEAIDRLWIYTNYEKKKLQKITSSR